MNITTVEQMREMDRRAIEEYGIREELLMENAGFASFAVIRKTAGDVQGKRFTVVCGGGNNGGDGFVVARKLHSEGAEVVVYVLGDSERLRGAAQLNYDIVSNLAIELRQLTDIEGLRVALYHSDAVVDAIFGTGLTRAVEGIYAEAIEAINSSGRIVYSLDIPSGINGNTGEVMGTAVKADYTVTFGLPKLGNILYPGWRYGGNLTVSHISFPPELYEGRSEHISTETAAHEIGHKSGQSGATGAETGSDAHRTEIDEDADQGSSVDDRLASHKTPGSTAERTTATAGSGTSPMCEINTPPGLPDRSEEGHKGSFGKTLFVAGAASYFGAPYFSSISFLKAGGGYSRLASTSSVINAVGGTAHEVVFHPMKETSTGSIAYGNLEILKMLSSQVSFVVLGPGLSLNDETQKLIIELVKTLKLPLLLDGDGLTAVARNPHLFREREESTILTPHPGEMARLSGISVKEIEANRVDVTRDQAAILNAIIVLKGAHTVIAFPDGRLSINLSGNSGMGTAGSGDVLAGTIPAMFGQGLSVDDAVKAGVFIHGLAGDLAAAEIGEDGMTAHDILTHIPQAVKMYRELYSELMKNMVGCVEVE